MNARCDANCLTMKTVLKANIVLLSIFLVGCTVSESTAIETKKEIESKMEYTNKIIDDRMLIVLAAPPAHAEYYADVYDLIINYDIAYAKEIIGRDNVVILADKKAIPLLEKELPKDIILEAELEDIWMRDFTTVNPSNPIQFLYTPASQGGNLEDAKWIQSKFNSFAKKRNVSFKKTNLFLDGGNLVDNYKNKIIITDRFLEDNTLTKTQAKNELKTLFGEKTQIAIITPDDSSLAHADGMLMFINEDTILVNKYDEPIRSDIHSELESSFPGITVIEIDTSFDFEIWDERFESACGINVNAVLTNNYIYMPHFGKPSDDKVQRIIQENTKRQVIPVDASNVCFMGGSVRCLSWQLTGENAKKLITAARKR